MAGSERRRNPRHLCSHLVEIAWRDAEGGARSLKALLEDLSPEGAAVAVEEPLERGVAVEVDAGGFRADAVVRYRIPRENDFRLGLEFTGPCRWSEGEWRPDHLYLPGQPSKKRGSRR